MKYIIILAAATGLSYQAFTQDELLQNTLRPAKKKAAAVSMLVAGIETSTISYINTGTKDSSGIQGYLSAHVNIQHKSNFGLQVKTYALPGGSNPGFWLTSVSPYYANYKGNVLPYISYSRHLFHNNPAVPYSPVQNELYAQLRIKTAIIDPVAGLDVGFGKDEQNNNEQVSDVNAFVAASHIFAWEFPARNTALGIIPTLQLNAGTDRYYKFTKASKYISQNRTFNGLLYGNRRGRGGNNGGSGMETYTISTVNDFSVSNLEANLYLMFFTGSFSIEPSGSLFFPFRGDDRTVVGYWQINLNYWIK